MQGAPMGQDLLDRVESRKNLRGEQFDPDNYNKADTFHNMLSAQKTQYQANQILQDYQYKQDNLINILNKRAANNSQQFKVSSKGKFSEHVAEGPGEAFVRDIQWIKKANPQAAEQEINFYKRDYHLMEKRRF